MLLERQGVVVPYRTLHRFCVERCGFGRTAATVRVADGEPGVECQIDFGQLGLLADPVTGRQRKVHALIFTAVLFAAHVRVADLLPDAGRGDRRCEAAWVFFGGVFKVLIPDNASAIVADADAVNPRFTAGWLDYAQHCGFATDPARVRSPKDKPRVERAVQYVRGNFFAGEDFTDLADAQARAEAWCRDVAGMRIHGTIQARPAEVFAEHEAGALLPLPGALRRADVHAVKVHRDFHVEVGRALYSAPKEYMGCHLDARADSALVKLFYRGQLVKTHPRQQPGGRSTDPADLPAEKTAYAMRDVASLAKAARRHGDAIGRLRRAAAGHRPAVDQDAPGLPAARPGPPLRPRPGRHRLRAGAGPRRGQRHQDRLDAGEGHREHTAAAAPSGGRCRPVRPRPRRVPHPAGTQLTLIDGGEATR